MTAATEAIPAPAARVRHSPLAFVRRHVLTVYSMLVFAYLLLPIVIVVLFSFNEPKGRFNVVWNHFTWDNWVNWDAVSGIRGSIEVSLEVAAIASIAATALGTLIALALVRYRFRGRGSTNLLIFLPMASPEIVLGAALLTLFLSINVELGFWTITIAHVMFCISYVVVTVKARLVSFDRHLEEAAMDLGANEWKTFQKVTLPLIAPAILASLLLCFAISVDDFVVTYFVAGNQVTFPIFVWGAARVATPPQINVIGTMIFVVAVGGMLASIVLQNRRARVRPAS
jgi:spermidine/putrescine transport system permease protein